ncbi:MAG: protease, partial [Thermocrispum sp.]
MTQEGSEHARYLVLFEDDAMDEGARAMTSVAGIKTVRGADFAAQTHEQVDTDIDGVRWDDLGVAVVSAGADQIRALS